MSITAQRYDSVMTDNIVHNNEGFIRVMQGQR